MKRVLVVLALLLAGRAAAEPSNERLFWIGVALAPPTYIAGVTLHEGMHAVAAKIVGAEVDELHLFPPGVDPKAHVFRFGWTYVHGLKTRNEKVFFFLAPKIVDVTLLGGFAALVYTSAWPRNRYGQLALTVGATGLWVDFAKDVVLLSPKNDVSQAFDNWCITGWRHVTARLLYAAADVGLAFVVARGYERTFTTPMPTMVPLLTDAF